MRADEPQHRFHTAKTHSGYWANGGKAKHAASGNVPERRVVSLTMDALIVIDMQQGMFSIPGFVPHDGAAIVQRIGALIDRARAHGTPVFFVQHDGGPGHPLAAGTSGFAFHADLMPTARESITVKRQCSAFHDTGLDAMLKAMGVTRVVVICGMQTETCVDTAVRAAAERGYQVTLVADAHTTGDTPVLKATDIIAHHNQTLAETFALVKPALSIRFGEGAFPSAQPAA
jgi:nicotinamidase-related amidase